MATSLATVRTSLATALAGVTTAQVYRRRQTNYQFPALVVGWPAELDFSPAMGDPRDFLIDVHVACEVTEDDSSDDLLSTVLESAVTVLQADDSWNVQPATDFGEDLAADGRTIVWCRLPVMVFA